MQCLSFPLTVATLFTSTSWVFYGLQLRDYYIVVRHGEYVSKSFLCTQKFPSFLIQSTAECCTVCSLSSLCSLKVPNTPGILTSLIRFYLFWRFASITQGSPSYKPLHIWGWSSCVTVRRDDRCCWRSALKLCHWTSGRNKLHVILSIQGGVLATMVSSFG